MTEKEACKKLPDLRNFLFSRDLFIKLSEWGKWYFDSKPYLKELFSPDNYSFEAGSFVNGNIMLQLGYFNAPMGAGIFNRELENYICKNTKAEHGNCEPGGGFSFSDKDEAYDCLHNLTEKIGKHNFTFKLYVPKKKTGDFLERFLSIENLPKELADYINCNPFLFDDTIPLWKNQVFKIRKAQDEDSCGNITFDCPWHDLEE